MTEITWFLIDEDSSMSAELRDAFDRVHRRKGSVGSVKAFEKLFTKEARKLGVLKPKERPVITYRFNHLAVGRTA
jgi:hypothetical protein